MDNNEKKCWACKRVLIGQSTLGLCPDCVNKYGTPTALFSTGLVGVGIRYGAKLIRKNGDKILSGLITGLKILKG